MKQYLLLILSVLLVICCIGCGNTEQANISTEILSMQPESPVSTPASTPAPTRTPSPGEEPIAHEPELTLHSGLREDGSFSDRTLFIGDSLTYIFTGSFLPENGLIGDAKYTAICGSQITAFFDSTVLKSNNPNATRYSEEFEGMGYDEAAAFLGANANAIYIMWGTNFTPDATAESYIEIVNFLLEKCPNATIHLQTIPHGNVSYTTVNQRIADAYAHYQQEGESRVMLIDTYTAIGDHTVDGVHLDQTGNRNWYEAIVEHAKLNNLPE